MKFDADKLKKAKYSYRNSNLFHLVVFIVVLWETWVHYTFYLRHFCVDIVGNLKIDER